MLEEINALKGSFMIDGKQVRVQVRLRQLHFECNDVSQMWSQYARKDGSSRAGMAGSTADDQVKWSFVVMEMSETY